MLDFLFKKNHNKSSVVSCGILFSESDEGKENCILEVPKQPSEYHYDCFTGRIKFYDNDCQVRKAKFTIQIGEPAYLCGVVAKKASLYSLNKIIWEDGEVVSGNLSCSEWKSGKFCGDNLYVDCGAENLIFCGNKLECNIFSDGEVHSGDVNCEIWESGIFQGNVLDCEEWICGVFSGKQFRDKRTGEWKDGFFKCGKFNGIWKGGVWVGEKGVWNGRVRIGDGTFSSVKKQKE